MGIDPTVWLVERFHSDVQSIFEEVLTMDRIEVISVDQQGPTTSIAMMIVPHLAAWVPSAAAKSWNCDGLHLIETVELEEKLALGPPFEITATIFNSALGAAGFIQSRMVFADAGGGATRVTFYDQVEVRLPMGLGWWAERLIKNGLKDAHRQVPEVVARWVAMRRRILAGPRGVAALREGLPFSVDDSPWIPPAAKQALALDPSPSGTPVQALKQDSTLTRFYSSLEGFPDEIDDVLEDPKASKSSRSLSRRGISARKSLDRLETVARWSRRLGLIPPPPEAAEPLESGSSPPGSRKKQGVVKKTLDRMLCRPQVESERI